MKKYKFTPEKEKGYQKLLADIRKLVDEAKAKGVDFFQRDDLYTCKHCGAYEDVSIKGERFTVHSDGRHSKKEFITIDRKERGCHRGNTAYYTTRYQFICGVCGKLQHAAFKCRFDD